MNHLVAISGGKDSTAMALRLAEVEPKDYQFLITPTGRELPEMEAHWKKIECLLGKPLVRIPAPSMLDLIKQFNALPNWRMRWCTRMIKIEPFMAYAIANKPAMCYVGIRADEANDRDGTDWNGIEGVKQETPLSRWGWGINKVLSYLKERDMMPPPRTDCDICFFQRIAEWWRLWKFYPERYAEGEAMEHLTGHTFRSDKRDTWGTSMKNMRLQFESGLVPKGAAQINLPFDVASRPTMCAWCAR